MVQWIDFVFVLCTIATYEMRAYKINKHPRTPQSTSLAMISVGRIKRQRPFTSAAGLPETGRIGVRRPALAAIGAGNFRLPARDAGPAPLRFHQKVQVEKTCLANGEALLVPFSPDWTSVALSRFFFFFFWPG